MCEKSGKSLLNTDPWGRYEFVDAPHLAVDRFCPRRPLLCTSSILSICE